MRTDPVDRDFGELLDRARPPLGAGWEERAAARIAPPAPGAAGRLRLAARVLGALVVLTALGFVPYSVGGPLPPGNGARQAALATAEGSEAAQPASPSPQEALPHEEALRPMEEQLAPYRQRAAAFVATRCPKDARMLMAAGLMTTDRKRSLELLKRAVDTSDSPLAWAAYVQRLRTEGPRYERMGYERMGTMAVDPGNPDQVAEGKRQLQEIGLPDRLTPDQAAPLLTALKGWEAADPENAIPLVYEVHTLYGLHEDTEALHRWQAAAQLPVVNGYTDDQERAVADLLTRMGMSSFQALSLTAVAGGDAFMPYANVRQCARIAQYEGLLAHMQNRPREAIAWWNSTIAVGQHMQDSADLLIEFLVGVAVEGIGASPAWTWRLDLSTAIPNGPLFRGRYFWGRQHEFYLSQVGEAANSQLRDRLVRAKVRSMLTRGAIEALSGAHPWTRGRLLFGLAAFVIGVLAGLLLLYLAIGVWRRRQADEATALRAGWALLLALLVPIPVLLMVLAAWRLGAWQRGMTAPLIALLTAAPALSLLAALLLPLLAALRSRRPGARLATAWRGNLRRTLPLAMVACAAIIIGLAVTAKVSETIWLRNWIEGERHEMKQIAQDLGPAWTNPTLPPDSWRAQYPPQPKAGFSARGRGSR